MNTAISKTQALQKLFSDWMDYCTEMKCCSTETSPVYKDGIINDCVYDVQPVKILFIAKEPNEANHKDEKAKCFATNYHNGSPKYKFAKQIAQWSYGIPNNFLLFDKASDDIQYLKANCLYEFEKIARRR